VINGPYPFHALGVPVLQVAFETAAVSAAGIRAALAVQGRDDIAVLAWAGDGGTFDIGFQSLSGAGSATRTSFTCATTTRPT
jgi:pyruvate ferredoxin oxidoreductase beta subunit/2-oxoisovalerate ferredoxin oxidoreductase beta subunit